MGFSLAEAFASLGANVTLITGPVQLTLKSNNINRIDVESADQMYQKCMQFFPDSNIVIMAAAVADFKPAQQADNKIKKEDKPLMDIKLHPTKDILKSMGALKTKNQILGGFALETDNELANAKSKLHNKNLDFVVLNSLNDKGAGFHHDTNKIKWIDKNNNILDFDLKTKDEVAFDIVNQIMIEFLTQ